jgi:hypothetical protein
MKEISDMLRGIRELERQSSNRKQNLTEGFDGYYKKFESLSGKKILLEDKIYPNKIIDAVAKKLGDESDRIKNMIAIFGLYRKRAPFNKEENGKGDIAKIKSVDQLIKLYGEWFDNTVKEISKSKELFDEYQNDIDRITDHLSIYVANIRSLGEKATPMIIKNMEGFERTFFDLVTRWRIEKEEKIKGGYSIESPEDEDILYENEEIIILKGSTRTKCLNYGRGQTWCISQPQSNYYNSYRINQKASIYFVLQKNKPETSKEKSFVIMVYGRDSFSIADRTNTGHRSGSSSNASSWDKIEREMPVLDGKKEYFVYIPPTEEEQKYEELVNDFANFMGKNPNLNLTEEIKKRIKGLKLNNSFIEPKDFIVDYVVRAGTLNEKHFSELDDNMINALIEGSYPVTPTNWSKAEYSGNPRGNQKHSKEFDVYLTPAQIRRYNRFALQNDFVITERMVENMNEEDFENFVENDIYKKYVEYRPSKATEIFLKKYYEYYKDKIDIDISVKNNEEDILEKYGHVSSAFYLSKDEIRDIIHQDNIEDSKLFNTINRRYGRNLNLSSGNLASKLNSFLKSNMLNKLRDEAIDLGYMTEEEKINKFTDLIGFIKDTEMEKKIATSFIHALSLEYLNGLKNSLEEKIKNFYEDNKFHIAISENNILEIGQPTLNFTKSAGDFVAFISSVERVDMRKFESKYNELS